MTLYKRPNSKYWWFKFVFEGALVQQTTKCANKRDALTFESAYRTQLAMGKIGIEPKKAAPTFEKAIEDFLARGNVEHGAQPGTRRRYYYACQSLKKFFGKVKVNQIEQKDVEDFLAWRSAQKSRRTKEPVTRKTVNFDLFILKMILARLADARVLRESPARSVKQLSEAENSFHVLSEREEKQYLLAAPAQLADVAALMLETGMRCGEVYGLRREDVLLEKGYLKVTKGKTKSSLRRVHLSDKAQDILRGRLEKFSGEILFPRKDIDGREQIENLNAAHLKTIRALGFDFRLYDCRHTFATRALESGVDLLTLASILGHANLKMVSRYAHPSEDHKRSAIAQMDKTKTGKTAKIENIAKAV